MAMNPLTPEAQDRTKKLGQVIARTWTDEDYKQRLIADPKSALSEHGIEFPPGHEVRVVQNDASVSHVVLPERPKDLSDDDLDQAAGGFCCEIYTSSHH